MKTYVIVRLQIEGLHNWPAAKEVFPEVGFLSDPHRHMFHIEAKKEVFHDDRDVEFIMFKRDLEKYLINRYHDGLLCLCNFENRSCEMIAKELLEQFNCKSVTVWEDLENGAIVEA